MAPVVSKQFIIPHYTSQQGRYFLISQKCLNKPQLSNQPTNPGIVLRKERRFLNLTVLWKVPDNRLPTALKHLNSKDYNRSPVRKGPSDVIADLPADLSFFEKLL